VQPRLKDILVLRGLNGKPQGIVAFREKVLVLNGVSVYEKRSRGSLLGLYRICSPQGNKALVGMT
jgi:hypothetical protein